MGLLMLGGMILSMAYGGYTLKKEAEAIMTDYCVKPCSKETKQETIRRSFVPICKRCGIALNENKKPINKSEVYLGVNYLKRQGYSEKETEYFKRLFNQKFNEQKYDKNVQIRKRNRELLKRIQSERCDKEIVYRREIYNSSLKPQDRMKKLMDNKLWSTMVHHYTFVEDCGVYKFEEIWTLRLPQYMRIDLTEIYRDICYLQKIEYRL